MVMKNCNLFWEGVENIMGKEEKAGYQHFLLSPKCFQKAGFLIVLESRDCEVNG